MSLTFIPGFIACASHVELQFPLLLMGTSLRLGFALRASRDQSGG